MYIFNFQLQPRRKSTNSTPYSPLMKLALSPDKPVRPSTSSMNDSVLSGIEELNKNDNESEEKSEKPESSSSQTSDPFDLGEEPSKSRQDSDDPFSFGLAKNSDDGEGAAPKVNQRSERLTALLYMQ